MSFLTNPIKINVVEFLDEVLTIKREIIMVGNVPSDVRRQLERGPSTAKKSRLFKFYGKNWKEKLGLKSPRPTTGADEDIQELFFTADEFLEESVFVFEDGSTVGDEPTTAKSPSAPKPKPTPRPKPVSKELFKYRKYSYISVYPEDRISEFKAKVFAATGIPMYRQHMYIVFRDTAIPMRYKITNDISLATDIRTVWDDAQLVSGLPVNPKLYRSRDTLRIEAYDSFMTVGNIQTTYGGITTFYVMDLDSFITPQRQKLEEFIKTDKYQLELVYYGLILRYWPQLTLDVFKDYLSNYPEMETMYPMLHPQKTKLMAQLNAEKGLIDRVYTKKPPGFGKFNPELAADPKKIVDVAIKSATLRVKSKGVKINVRNLFDNVRLDKRLPFVKVKLLHKGKEFVLTKVRASTSYTDTGEETGEMLFEQIKYKIKLPHYNTLLVIIKLPCSDDDPRLVKCGLKVTSDRFLTVIFYEDGTYLVRSIWDEKAMVHFDDIIQISREYVNPFVKHVNQMGSTVFNIPGSIDEIWKSNSEFINLSLSVFWKKTVTKTTFDAIMQGLGEYVRADIINSHGDDLFFNKGITGYDPRQIERTLTLPNYYVHLSDPKVRQRWNYLFERGRPMTIIHRVTDIKIEIQNMREHEFKTFYRLMINFFFEMDKISAPVKQEVLNKSVKKLKKLKEHDPEGYDFKIYGSDVVYSKICQKPHQPIIYSETEIEMLPPKVKKSLVKYWNFTTNSPSYFYCSNPKFPNLSFITGVHPKNFCIPCCKKTAPDGKSRRVQIYETCMDTHEYFEEKQMAGASRYIMGYGKDIEVDRLGRLPELIDKFLLYNVAEIPIPTSGNKTKSSRGYFLYGVPQNVANYNNIGSAFSIAHAMDLEFDVFIQRVIAELAQQPNIFKILLRGRLMNHFANVDELIDIITYLFLSKDIKVGVLETDNKFADWNELFIDVAKIVFGISVIIINDKKISAVGTSLKEGDADIDLILPEKMDKIDDVFSADAKYMLLLRRTTKAVTQGRVYYPIYIVNPRDLFRGLAVEKKTFTGTDEIIKLIQVMVLNVSKKTDAALTKSIIDLDILEKFAKASKSSIVKRFVNSQNLCYAVILKMAPGHVYIPISYSVYKYQPTDEFKPFYRSKHKLPLTALKLFMKKFNGWIIEKSKKLRLFKLGTKEITPLYPLVKPEAILMLQKKQIGFVNNTLYYYFTSGTLDSSLPKHRLYYDPDKVNKAIVYDAPQTGQDPRYINKILYNHYLYDIFVIQMVNYFNTERNKKIRSLLAKLISKTNFRKDLFSFNEELEKLILNEQDLKKIKAIASMFYTTHFDKKRLLREINAGSYNFDKEEFQKLLAFDEPKLLSRLEKIAKSITLPGSPKIDEMPNKLTSCIDFQAQYCKGKKLYIPRGKLKTLIETFANDIMNPVKRNYIMSLLFTRNVRDLFKFKKRIGEEIYISV